MTGMMPRNTFLSSTRFPPTFLGKQGADTGNLLRAEPQQPGHHPSPPGAFLGLPSGERAIPRMMSPDPGDLPFAL